VLVLARPGLECTLAGLGVAPLWPGYAAGASRAARISRMAGARVRRGRYHTAACEAGPGTRWRNTCGGSGLVAGWQSRGGGDVSMEKKQRKREGTVTGRRKKN